MRATSKYPGGTVALFPRTGSQVGYYLAFYDAYNNEWVSSDYGRLGKSVSDDENVHQVLAVVDPDDRGQMTELSRILEYDYDWENCLSEGVDDLSGALRKLRDTPIVQEPAEYSVVKARSVSRGTRYIWTRVEDQWHGPGMGGPAVWSELRDVEVLHDAGR